MLLTISTKCRCDGGGKGRQWGAYTLGTVPCTRQAPPPAPVPPGSGAEGGGSCLLRCQSIIRGQYWSNNYNVEKLLYGIFDNERTVWGCALPPESYELNLCSLIINLVSFAMLQARTFTKLRPEAVCNRGWALSPSLSIGKINCHCRIWYPFFLLFFMQYHLKFHRAISAVRTHHILARAKGTGCRE